MEQVASSYSETDLLLLYAARMIERRSCKSLQPDLRQRRDAAAMRVGRARDTDEDESHDSWHRCQAGDEERRRAEFEETKPRRGKQSEEKKNRILGKRDAFMPQRRRTPNRRANPGTGAPEIPTRRRRGVAQSKPMHRTQPNTRGTNPERDEVDREGLEESGERSGGELTWWRRPRTRRRRP